MNKQGEMQIGVVIMIAIVAIVGAILLTASAQNLGPFRNTVVTANVTLVDTNGTSNLIGIAHRDVVVYNATDDLLINAGNYTIANYQVVDGELTATITTVTDSVYQGAGWLLSSTYEPEGYSTSSGARSMGQIILIFFALGIAVVMLVPTTRNKIITGFTK